MQQSIHRVNHIVILPAENETEGISLQVYGNTFTNGWTEISLIPLFSEHGSENGVYEFRFVGTAPEMQPLPVTTAINAGYTFPAELDNLKKIIVYAETNILDALCSIPVAREPRHEKSNLLGAMKSFAYSLATGILPSPAHIQSKTIQHA